MVKAVGGGDELADLVVGYDDVARVLRIRQTGKSDIPCVAILDALVMLRGQLQRGTQAAKAD